MTDVATGELEEFFDFMWRDDRGYVYLPVKFDNKWTPFMFSWPRQMGAVVRHALKWSATGGDVYHCPALFKAARPTKENVAGSWFLWCDMDGNAPASWPILDTDGSILIPEPTLIMQSSIPGHEHAYWELDERITDISVLEDRNRAIAYALQADTSGWDADQVLRPPHTVNQKRHMPVEIKVWND